MRLILATWILCAHSLWMTNGKYLSLVFDVGLPRVAIFAPMPMFFALSGFLVSASLDRTRSLVTFAGLRALRIVPALFVDTIFSALVLGPIFTSLRLTDYFSSSKFARYFLNIVGDIHYSLPGVFAANADSSVNAQLWTVPYELGCYLALFALALIGLFRRRTAMLLAIFVAQAVYFAVGFFVRHSAFNMGQLLVLSYLAGTLLHLYRGRVPLHWSFFIISTVASTACYVIPALIGLAAIPTAYAVVYLGLLNPPKLWLVRSGDYSYGIYLYGYPLQQALLAALPIAKMWYGNLLLSVPITFAFAYLSWNVVEKRALKLRRLAYRAEAWWPMRWNYKSPAAQLLAKRT